MAYKLISCDVFFREMCQVVSGARDRVDMHFLPKGLHDLPSTDMRARLQAAVDDVDESDYEAVLLGYGLCNNGLHGVQARGIPLVLPRAHDCITLFFGSRQRYLDYFWKHPGVYFKTSGWIERGEAQGDLKQLSIEHLQGMDMTYEEMEEKYGEDNARYLYETLVESVRHTYRQFTFIEMGVEPDDRFERETERLADEKGWAYEKVRGNLSLFERLVNGEWNDEDFLVVRPGHRIVARYDDGIVSESPDASGSISSSG